MHDSNISQNSLPKFPNSHSQIHQILTPKFIKFHTSNSRKYQNIMSQIPKISCLKFRKYRKYLGLKSSNSLPRNPKISNIEDQKCHKFRICSHSILSFPLTAFAFLRSRWSLKHPSDFPSSLKTHLTDLVKSKNFSPWILVAALLFRP